VLLDDERGVATRRLTSGGFRRPRKVSFLPVAVEWQGLYPGREMVSLRGPEGRVTDPLLQAREDLRWPVPRTIAKPDAERTPNHRHKPANIARIELSYTCTAERPDGAEDMAARTTTIADVVPTPQAIQLYKVFRFTARARVNREPGQSLDIRSRFRGGKAHFQAPKLLIRRRCRDGQDVSWTVSALDTMDILRVGGVHVSTTPWARFE
jgi:hypothetical protein